MRFFTFAVLPALALGAAVVPAPEHAEGASVEHPAVDNSQHAPIANEPVAPIVNEPVTPIVNEPVAPIVNEPVAPVVNQPNAPAHNETAADVVAPVQQEQADKKPETGKTCEYNCGSVESCFTYKTHCEEDGTTKVTVGYDDSKNCKAFSWYSVSKGNTCVDKVDNNGQRDIVFFVEEGESVTFNIEVHDGQIEGTDDYKNQVCTGGWKGGCGGTNKDSGYCKLAPRTVTGAKCINDEVEACSHETAWAGVSGQSKGDNTYHFSTTQKQWGFWVPKGTLQAGAPLYAGQKQIGATARLVNGKIVISGTGTKPGQCMVVGRADAIKVDASTDGKCADASNCDWPLNRGNPVPGQFAYKTNSGGIPTSGVTNYAVHVDMECYC